ncbi:MAG: hypothetical protein N4A72_09860 [Bacteroidales bacterium]|jgi:hypothetical protein|nr:hypothetical protein [Bacteroidales bacterium]
MFQNKISNIKVKPKDIVIIVVVALVLAATYFIPDRKKEVTEVNNTADTEITITDKEITEPNSRNSRDNNWIQFVLWAGVLGASLYYMNRVRKRNDMGFIKTSVKPINGFRKLKIVVYNLSKKDITINAPIIVFSKGSEERKFKITNVANHSIYPLVVREKTGHLLNTDLNIFTNRIPELNSFTHFRIECETTSGKSLKSIKRRIK